MTTESHRQGCGLASARQGARLDCSKNTKNRTERCSRDGTTHRHLTAGRQLAVRVSTTAGTQYTPNTVRKNVKVTVKQRRARASC